MCEYVSVHACCGYSYVCVKVCGCMYMYVYAHTCPHNRWWVNDQPSLIPILALPPHSPRVCHYSDFVRALSISTHLHSVPATELATRKGGPGLR